MSKQQTLEQWKAYRKARALKNRAAALYPRHDVKFFFEVDPANPLGASSAVLTLKIMERVKA